jgi:hypothetical protein
MGTVVASPDFVQKRVLPYLSYNGEYGANDFVVVDFTGNNMPNLLFFGDTMSNSLFYDSSSTAEINKGIVVSNGAMSLNGLPVTSWMKENSVNWRIQVMGPTKSVGFGVSQDGAFRVAFAQQPHPASIYALTREENKNTQYRLMAGITSVSQTQFTVEMALADLTNSVLVGTWTQTIKNTNIQGNKAGETLFDESIFTGKIGLYGQFGIELTLDKVHPIEEDTSMDVLLEKYCYYSAFKSTALKQVNAEQVLSVSDYIVTLSDTPYTLKYVDENGTETVVTDETFSFAKSGVYTLMYCDGVHQTAKMPITVLKSVPQALTEEAAYTV